MDKQKQTKPKRMLTKEEVREVLRRRYAGTRSCFAQRHGVRYL